LKADGLCNNIKKNIKHKEVRMKKKIVALMLASVLGVLQIVPVFAAESVNAEETVLSVNEAVSAADSGG